MIRLQFVSSADHFSKAIEIFSHGLVSHVDAVLPDGNLLGARLAGGVAIRQPNYEVFDRVIPVQLETTPEIANGFYAFLNGQIGKPYDVLAIASYAVGRDWRGGNAWYCSELIAAGLELGYFKHHLVSTTSKIDPWDLLLILSAMVDITI